MLLKTILNRAEKQRGFVYSDAKFNKAGEIEIEIVPRQGCKPICDSCGKKATAYDKTSIRRFEFVPVWAFAVFFVYHMRRVDCPRCGIKTERVPWSCGKNHLTYSYRIFLATWAKRLSWQETARVFQTSWDSVYRSIEWLVSWGLIRQDLTGVEAIGIDEIQYRRGHKYLTLVYQLDEGRKRLLHVARDRTEASLRTFFKHLSKETIEGLKFACTDMWAPYLKVLKECAPQTLNILDRFHISKKFGEALDKVRAEESKMLKHDGYDEVLKNSRWCLLKRRSNLTGKQTVKLHELLKYNLKTMKAYLMREDFDHFWTYTSPTWASKFLREWCVRASRSRIEPMQKIAKMLRSHEGLLLNWFESQGLSSGIVEGFNNKAKLTMRKAYGFKQYESIEIALYHQLGNLPEPESTHKFC
jgi:transposase